MGEEAILAFTRVLGAAASNVAEAAVALLVMNAFERAQRRAEPAWSWLGSGPPADGGTEGPTEVVALGFVDLVASTAWGQSMALRDQILALTRFESAAWTSAALGRGRVITTIGFDVFSAAPTVEAACRIGLEICRVVGPDEASLPPGGRWGSVPPFLGKATTSAHS
jgi:adenylate cyclase